MEKNKMFDTEYQKMNSVEENHWWYKGLRLMLFYWINKLKPRKTLDAGCGTGINMSLLAKEYAIEGIDSSSLAIDYCKDRGLKNVKVSYVQDTGYSASYFDLVYCMDVLGIVPATSQEDTIKEFNRILTKDGYLILNCAAFQWLHSSHDVVCNLNKRFTSTELTKLLTKNGFTIEFVTYRVFLLFPLIAFMKLIQKLNMIIFRPKELSGDLEKSTPLINKVLFPVMNLEFSLFKNFSLPFGSSVFVVAKKR